MSTKKYVMPEKRLNIFVKAAVITFICFCVASIVGQQFTYNSYCRQEYELTAQIEKKNDSLEELRELLDQKFDDDYVKKIARKSLGYHMADEIIFYNDLAK